MTATLPPALDVAARAGVTPDARRAPFEVEDFTFSMALDAQSVGRLDATPNDTFDRVQFGVVGLSHDGEVLTYNRAESALSGLDPRRVIGRRFFTSVAPCTNNFLVAHRFGTETVLDEVVDYLFTFKMAPTPVRLRLIKYPTAERMYLFVERRPLG